MKQILSMILVAAALPMLAVAADKPNFSGTWKLNREKSVFPDMGGGQGGGRMAGEMTRVIVHQDPNLEIKTTMQGRDGNPMTMEVKLTTDGKEVVNKTQGRGGMGGGTATSKGSWEGGNFVVKTVRQISTPNGDITINSTETYTLAEDGKSMKVVAKNETPMGEIEITYAFDKVS